MYFVYVLKSNKDQKLYYGLTNDIDKRIKEHNLGLVRSTKSRMPLILVYFEKVDTLKDARRKERYFKTGFGHKYIKNKLALSSIG